MEDDLWWKTTSNARPLLMEDNLKRKMTFNWSLPSSEDDLQLKMTFHEGQPRLSQFFSFHRQYRIQDFLWERGIRG